MLRAFHLAQIALFECLRGHHWSSILKRDFREYFEYIFKCTQKSLSLPSIFMCPIWRTSPSNNPLWPFIWVTPLVCLVLNVGSYLTKHTDVPSVQVICPQILPVSCNTWCCNCKPTFGTSLDDTTVHIPGGVTVTCWQRLFSLFYFLTILN